MPFENARIAFMQPNFSRKLNIHRRLSGLKETAPATCRIIETAPRSLKTSAAHPATDELDTAGVYSPDRVADRASASFGSNAQCRHHQ
jgi:hypothetical protein